MIFDINIKHLGIPARNCFPLFIIEFVNVYNNNASKFIIDGKLSENVQAKFGFVAMPMFAIGLLSAFIYQPQIVNLAKDWENGRLIELRNRIIVQHFIWGVISLVVIIGSFFVGVPILSIVYATELSCLKTELMLLLVGGAFYSIARYYTILLTVARKHTNITVVYMIIMLIFLLLGNKVVIFYGTLGVAILFMIKMMILARVLLCLFILETIKKSKNQKSIREFI